MMSKHTAHPGGGSLANALCSAAIVMLNVFQHPACRGRAARPQRLAVSIAFAHRHPRNWP